MLAREGYPFILVPLIAGAVFAYFSFWILAIFFFLVTAFMAFFFRDPERTIPVDPAVIVSAADGTVTRIDENSEGKLVSVFLSPLDVHINRAPIGGKVTKVEYVSGRKLPATSVRSSFENERNSITIENAELRVVCTQIAGILARRIVCRVKEGDNLQIGDRFGLIKFSSRTDVLMPRETEVKVKLGDKVKGGVTVLGKIAQ
jgi:phosphatidylserine decarboxylase